MTKKKLSPLTVALQKKYQQNLRMRFVNMPPDASMRARFIETPMEMAKRILGSGVSIPCADPHNLTFSEVMEEVARRKNSPKF